MRDDKEDGVQGYKGLDCGGKARKRQTAGIPLELWICLWRLRRLWGQRGRDIGRDRAGARRRAWDRTAALAMLNDQVKKGRRRMASSYVGGLSGAFHPGQANKGNDRRGEDGSPTIGKTGGDDLRLFRRNLT